jgi:hypothetical protein
MTSAEAPLSLSLFLRAKSGERRKKRARERTVLLRLRKGAPFYLLLFLSVPSLRQRSVRGSPRWLRSRGHRCYQSVSPSLGEAGKAAERALPGPHSLFLLLAEAFRLTLSTEVDEKEDRQASDALPSYNAQLLLLIIYELSGVEPPLHLPETSQPVQAH